MNRYKQKKLVRQFIRIYTRLALVALGVFAVVGVWHPGFFTYGLHHLTTVLADDLNINGLVLPPPEAPTLDTELSCNPLNLSLALDLEWDLDSGNGTDTFDIYRNGVLMVAGLSASTAHYLDTSLTIATSYTYFVRANGPMGPGSADSVPVTLTTPYNCDGLTPPTVAVTMFNGRPLESYRNSELYNTTKRRPVVVGTSNIPYADIQIVIDGETRLVAHVVANLNGYWEWQPTPRLNYERSVMQITATDPLNSERYAVTSLPYQILREDGDSGEASSKKTEQEIGVPSGGYRAPGEIPAEELLALDFDTQGSEKVYSQGDVIQLRLVPTTLPSSESEKITTLHYRLVDDEGHGITTTEREVFLREGEEVIGAVEAPLYLRPGRYTVGVDFTYDRDSLTSSDQAFR
jgi:hypothetical protein